MYCSVTEPAIGDVGGEAILLELLGAGLIGVIEIGGTADAPTDVRGPSRKLVEK